MTDITHIKNFLRSETPASWVSAALVNIDTLLIDHANCEKKAASTAMNLMYRYVDKPVLLEKMAQLAREELLHFEQVVKLMKDRGVIYTHLGPSRYASALRDHIRTHEPARLVDIMIIGAFVEARSCERFASIAPHLEGAMQKYYLSLLRSEARHFEDYLILAREYAEGIVEEELDSRINFFAELETSLITTEDPLFRFHSGVPAGITQHM
jgi:tRNA 2-(methylsulfanyl)-N6-isopentenyladenosine37 hydroxylase